MSQKDIGLDVVAITSGFQAGIDRANEDIIDGIRYIRTSSRKETLISDSNQGIVHQLKKFLSIFSFSFHLLKTVNKEKPDVIHAHAMFFCGIPAIIIGKLKKIPVVYEFRSLWMFQKKEAAKTKTNRFIEKFLLSLESFTLRKSDAAVFLNEDLKEYFVKKNDFFRNSYVINNAVNLGYIKNLLQQNDISDSRDSLVFGYIGTLTAYEGLEFLVETFQELYKEGVKNKLLIFGDGISKSKIVNQIKKYPEIDTIHYLGSMKPQNIPEAFSQVDVIINPRLDNDVTQSVTPLKPLEAMAYRKLFIGSDVGGIAALVKDDYNGFLFKAEDKADLKATILKVVHLKDSEIVEILNRAVDFVEKEKSWRKNASEYKRIYHSLKDDLNQKS